MSEWYTKSVTCSKGPKIPFVLMGHIYYICLFGEEPLIGVHIYMYFAVPKPVDRPQI